MRESRGERRAFTSEVVEISALARAMAAAAVGLRGSDARKAMTEARRKLERERWSAVCEVTRSRIERAIERDVQQLEQRMRALLVE